MNNDETKDERQGDRNTLDLILLERDQLLPSSGFAASVMDAMQQQATVPAPIPFPWKLALPGLAALLAGLAVVCRLAFAAIESMNRDMNLSSTPASQPDWFAWLHRGAEPAFFLRTQAAPVLLALAASYICVALCRKMAVGRSIR